MSEGMSPSDKPEKTMSQIIIKIERPTGNIEEVDVTAKFAAMNDKTFAKIAAANKAAGRGIALGWEYREAEAELAEMRRVDAKIREEKAWSARNGERYDFSN